MELPIGIWTRKKRQVGFQPPHAMELTPAMKEELCLSYWDSFPFQDVVSQDMVHLEELFETYALLLVQADDGTDILRSLLRTASVSRECLDRFSRLAEKTFREPESPLRNDEYYIKVVEQQLATDFYNEEERRQLQCRLKKNF